MRLTEVMLLDVSVGPGPMALMATCLVIVNRIACRSSKQPRINQKEAKSLLKHIYMFLLRQVMDGTSSGNLILHAIVCRLNFYGFSGESPANVHRNIFDLHDVQVFLCMAHVLWFTFPKVVDYAARLGEPWACVRQDMFGVWKAHAVDFGIRLTVRLQTQWEAAGIPVWFYQGRPFCQLRQFCVAKGWTNPSQPGAVFLHERHYNETDQVIIFGVHQFLGDLPKRWLESRRLAQMPSDSDNSKAYAKRMDWLTPAEKSRRTRQSSPVLYSFILLERVHNQYTQSKKRKR